MKMTSWTPVYAGRLHPEFDLQNWCEFTQNNGEQNINRYELTEIDIKHPIFHFLISLQSVVSKLTYLN